MANKFMFIVRNFKYILYVFSFLIIASCEKSKYKAPIVFKGQGLENKIDISKSKSIIIKEGVTLYSIAKAEGVSVRSIINTNKLEPPFILYPGDKLVIPSALIHEVKKGDSLWKLSECYNIDIITIMHANNLNDNNLSIGKKLFIPSITHIDTKNCINNNSNSLVVSNENKIDEKIVENEDNVSNLNNAIYIWPVKGKLLSKFGIQDKGVKNDGVNIVAKKGQPVLAIQDGKVIYSGNEIQAFGNLILIKHGNNRTSAYAHVDDVKVVKGQIVSKGEQIAIVSNTGKVIKPQLHFEIRDDNGPIDPLKILPLKNL